MKVFCTKCEFFDPQYIAMRNPGGCTCPENEEVIETVDTWRDKGTKRSIYVEHPAELNSNNDCSWYKEK